MGIVEPWKLFASGVLSKYSVQTEFNQTCYDLLMGFKLLTVVATSVKLCHCYINLGIGDRCWGQCKLHKRMTLWDFRGGGGLRSYLRTFYMGYLFMFSC